MDRTYESDYDDVQPPDLGDGGLSSGETAGSRRPAWDDHSAAEDGGMMRVARELLEDQLRDRPIPTLLIALTAGWLVGKILR